MIHEFNAEKEAAEIVAWIKEYFAKNGPGHNAIVGISGGKDSTVVAALCAEALGPDRVIGVCMPQHTQHDLYTAQDVINTLGIRDCGVIDIGPICDTLYQQVSRDNCEKNSQITSNTPARIRMTVLYTIAAIYNGRVACTGNYSEDYIGYSTKWGDGAGDFAPLQDYTATEVIQIGAALKKIPNPFLIKAPEDGLTGLTDEENLGFSYKTLDAYLRDKIVPDAATLENITKRHNQNRHKIKALNLPGPRREDWRRREDKEGFYF